MVRIIIVCEGKTEVAFVRRILYYHLMPFGIFTDPRMIPTSHRSKGGALNIQRILHYLRRVLRQQSDTYVSTFFDLYALPTDFPGLDWDYSINDPIDRVKKIEQAFHEVVVREIGCRPERFLPYIQPHEFEALLFSDTTGFAKVIPAWKRYSQKLSMIRRNSKSPEHINDGINTHPSAQLSNTLDPEYKKVEHGEKVSAMIGIDTIRSECQHFDQWVEQIKHLTELGYKKN